MLFKDQQTKQHIEWFIRSACFVAIYNRKSDLINFGENKIIKIGCPAFPEQVKDVCWKSLVLV